ncbi:polysaccharide lyase [Mycolicibacterium fluoranthenivorans]|uniref:polysaccharide lyase n=1 Tax=Mycolicibacterium fluoranthenivorans TaxID=258505 RepID=UPI001F42EFF4|nr:polysaccharide lyase [Mycolicibacterium fluoranthenivorans]
MAIVAIAVWAAPPALGAAALFSGDYATGNFSQWPTVQVRGYNSDGKDYVPSYSAGIVTDPVKGNVARFEVRPGDVPPFGGGERAEVQGGAADTGGAEGQTRWYRFSTKFDPTFPMNHGDLGWGVTNQWHQDGSAGSPPVSWTVDGRNGYWSLTIEKQSSPGVWVDTFSIFDTPLDVGQWHDVTMQINWSASDEKGWIRLWHNGVRQTFGNGSDTYFVRTLVPGDADVYYKEGMYRKPTTSTDIVYHAGFRSADSADGL